MVKSKKAQTDIPLLGGKIITYLIFVIFLGFSVTYTGIAHANARTISDTISPKIENSILEYRFLNSADCFAYKDPYTNRVYPEIIDLNKFNDQQFLNCYLVGPESRNCFSLELEFDDKTKSVYSNNWVRCRVGQKTITESRTILVRENNQLKRAKLLIHKEKFIS